MVQSIPPSQWVSAVTKEHQHFEHLLTKFDDAVDQPHTKSDGLQILASLVEFCIGHIAHEEQIMQSMKYEAMNAHVADHSRILNELSNYLANYEVAGDGELLTISNSARLVLGKHQEDYDDFLLQAIRSMEE